MKKILMFTALATIAAVGPAWAASVHVTMRTVNSGGVGDIIGMIEFRDSAKGLKIIPNLKGLTPGQHGTHVHQNPACGTATRDDGTVVPGLAAGGHYDPANTGKHEGPQGMGHLGDLPVLYVNRDGTATRSSWAPRLKVSDLKGRAIVIHSGGDNYSDQPKKLGGGGSRVACGVVIN